MIIFENAELEDDDVVRDAEGKYVRAKNLPMGATARRYMRDLGAKVQERYSVVPPPSSKRLARNESMIWLQDETGTDHLVHMEDMKENGK